MRDLDVLLRLSRGEILEYQSRKYFLRGDRVQAKLGRKLVRNGLAEPPPNLFAPDGGRITTLGMLKLQELEKTHA